jgi:starch synthase
MPGWDVEVITGRGFGPGDADHALASVRVPYLGSPERWTAALAWHRGLSAVPLKGRPDVVVSLELHAPIGPQVSRLARSLHVPHVVAIWETLADNPLYSVPPWRNVQRRIVRDASLFVCFTERARRHAIARGCEPSRCVVVYPGIDTQTFRPDSRPPSPDRPLLFVGELRPDKGIEDVIRAFDLAHARGIEARLVVIGQGPLEREVADAAVSRPYLEYRGRVVRHEVAESMRRARALIVAPFRRRFWEEQFGYVYAEAMASGIPVIATRSGAIPEVVPAENRIVDEHDIDGLAEAIAWSAQPEATDVGSLNRQVALDRFDLARQGQRLEGVLVDHLSNLTSRVTR